MRLHKSKKDILNGNISQQILLFTVPIMGSYLLQQLYQFVDSIVLGRYAGVEAMAAVGGSATMIINILNNFIAGLASGLMIVVAQNYGRGNSEKVSATVKSGMFICFVLGGITTIINCLLSKTILKLTNCPIEIINESTTYLCLVFAGTIPYMLYNFGNNILRATGDTKRSLLFEITIVVVKITLDIILTAILKLGVWGVGISTLVSYIACGIIVLYIFNNTPDCIQYNIKNFGYDSEMLINIFKIGLPVAIQSVLFAFTNLLIQIKINVFKTDTIAAFSIYNSVDNFYWSFSNAIGSAVITIAGQNYGNKNMKRVHETIKFGLIIDLIASIAIGAFNYYLGRYIFNIFTTDINVINIATDMIKVISIYYTTYSLVEIISCAIKGCGDSVNSMIIALIGICAVRIVYLLTSTFTKGVQIIYCYPISWAITSLIYLVYYLANKKYRLAKNN